MQYVTRPRITELNPHLLCVLCGGYYIDATAIIECLHSFCKSCIVRYLETRKYCPICDVLVHKTKPLQNLRPDTVLQSIVYKLVPNLYEKEMRNRRNYYGKVHFTQHPRTAEEKGVITESSKFYSSSDSIDFSLEYVNYSECHFYVAANSQRYFRCQASVTIDQLRKLIEAKYATTAKHKVRFFYNEIQLPEHLTMLDVAYISAWKRLGFIRLLYEIQLEKKVTMKPQPLSLTDVVESTPETFSSSPRNESAPNEDTTAIKTSSEQSLETVTVLEPMKETSPMPVVDIMTASSPVPSTVEEKNEIAVTSCSLSTATNTSTSSVTVTCSMDSSDITTSSVGSPIATSACVVTVNGISSPQKVLSPIVSPCTTLDVAEQTERSNSEINIEENMTTAVEQLVSAPEKTKDTNETARVPSPPSKRPLEEETRSMPIEPSVNPSEESIKPAKIPKLSGLVEKILSASKLPGLTIELQKTVAASTSEVSSTPVVTLTTSSMSATTSVKASVTVVPSLRAECVQKSSPRPIFNRMDVPTITKSTTKIMKNFTRPWNCTSTNFSSPDIVDVNNKSKSSKIIKVRPTPPRSQVERSIYGAPSLSPSSNNSSSIEDPVKKSSVPHKIYPVMKIDPQTLSPIVTTTASSIVPVSATVPKKTYSPYIPPVSELYTSSGPFTSSGLSTYTSPNLTTKPPGSYVMPNPLLPINQLMYEMYGNGSRTFEYMKAMTTNFCPPSMFHPSLHPSMNPFYNTIQKKYEKKARLNKGPSSNSSPPSVQRIPPSNNNTKLAISEHSSSSSSSEKKPIVTKHESMSNGQLKHRTKKTDTSSSFSINNLIPLEMGKHTSPGTASSHACSADGVHQICDQMQSKKMEHKETMEMKKTAVEGNLNNLRKE